MDEEGRFNELAGPELQNQSVMGEGNYTGREKLYVCERQRVLVQLLPLCTRFCLLSVCVCQ